MLKIGKVRFAPGSLTHRKSGAKTAPVRNSRTAPDGFPRYTVEWIGREGLDTETHEEYLQHFITHFYRNITKLVDRAMRKEDSSAQGQIVTEILQHLHACNNAVKVRGSIPCPGLFLSDAFKACL